MGLGYGLLIEPHGAITATLLRVCAPRLSKACPSKKNRMTLYTPPRQTFQTAWAQETPAKLNPIYYYTAGRFANPIDQYGHHHQSPDALFGQQAPTSRKRPKPSSRRQRLRGWIRWKRQAEPLNNRNPIAYTQNPKP